jgi:hypothetical protein
MFFGILTAQVCKRSFRGCFFSLPNLSSDIYYTSFPQDRVLFKLAVAWVYLVGMAQTGLALLDVRTTWTTGLQALHNAGDVPSLSPDHLWLSITISTAAGAG